MQTSRWNMARIADRESRPIRRSARCCARKGWIVDLDEAGARPERYGGLLLPAWLASVPSAGSSCRCRSATNCSASSCWPRAHAVQVNWEVSDLLKTASRQAAGFLAQMHATEALLEARKFDAFNRMSAFVVHDLKNIVTQLSLMLKNAKRLHANPEFQQDMLITVENSLEKMRQLMLQLREGEAPAGQRRRRRAGADRPAHRGNGSASAAARSSCSVVERVVTRGHEDRIERVIGHVVQNALDATPPDGPGLAQARARERAGAGRGRRHRAAA